MNVSSSKWESSEGSNWVWALSFCLTWQRVWRETSHRKLFHSLPSKGLFHHLSVNHNTAISAQNLQKIRLEGTHAIHSPYQQRVNYKILHRGMFLTGLIRFQCGNFSSSSSSLFQSFTGLTSPSASLVGIFWWPLSPFSVVLSPMNKQIRLLS